SPGERYDQWRLVRDGGVKVVVGVRSAVFAPLSDIGIIIIDEEHESTYKSDITPRFHAGDVARERCIYNGALLLKGSATPSVESYYQAVKGRTGLLEMTKRANNKGLPDVIMVDMRNELSEGNRSVFSRALSSEISKNMEQKMQTILFLNRRGYASFVLCRECGYTARCVSCNISLTYHAKEGRLICHYCGYTVKMPEICPKCKSKYIRHFGTGTQKVEEELKKVFPGIRTVRMDMDTTLKKNSHEKILSSFREDNIEVMVGTQMIAKGHDFPGVTLVGVLAADSLLNLEDFRASERTFQLVTQVAGRAGRGLHGGRVVIQTYNTEDFSIKAACRQDYGEFYKNEILIRERLGYPPFSNVAIIILSGTEDLETKETLLKIKEYASEEFAKCGVEADVLGPSRAPLSKINNRYRWRIVIKCGCEDSIIKVFDAIQTRFRKMANKDRVRMTMDINPYNMM
ncbi:MAG TPA: primosomal protein N', partial [Clostridia bacterium]